MHLLGWLQGVPTDLGRAAPGGASAAAAACKLLAGAAWPGAGLAEERPSLGNGCLALVMPHRCLRACLPLAQVHQIFQDLAVLVNDQGEQLEDIEANITRAGERAADATVQIARAERSQRAARSKWCFLLAITAVVLFILILIILA